MTSRARIDGAQVFLDGEQLPAVSLSVQDLIDPSKVKGSRSSTIRVLNTKEARIALGGEGMNEVNTARPTLVIDNGAEPQFTSEIIPVRHTRELIECIAVGGNAAWFEWAKTTKLDEINLGQSVPLNVDSVMSTWTDATSLLYFLLADYGYLEGRADTFDVQMWDLRPAFRLKLLLDAAFAQIGYRIEAKGRLIRMWDKAAILQPADAITPHFIGHVNGGTASSATTGAYTLSDHGSVPQQLNLATVLLDPASQWGSSEFVPDATGEFDIRVDGTGLAFDPFSPPTDGDVFHLVLFDFTDSVVVDTSSKQYATGDEYVRWWHTFEGVTLTAGHDYGFGVQRPSGGFAGTADELLASIVTFEPVDPLHSRTYMRWNEEDFTAYGLANTDIPIQLSQALPSISVMDALNALGALKDLVFDTDTASGVISVWHSKDFYRSPAQGVRDWSLRMDHSTPPAKILDQRPRVIRYRFKEDRTDDLLSIQNKVTGYPGYGNGDVSNPVGYGKEEEVKLPFSATVSGPMFGGNITAPILRDAKGDYQVDEYDREPRLLIIGGMATGDWKFGSVNRTEYPSTYFASPDTRGHAIHFDNATAGYLGTLASDWLRTVARMRSKVLECFVFINDSELKAFDFGKPTLMNDGHSTGLYYIQEIIEHRFGTGLPTKVRAIQIDSAAHTYGVEHELALAGGDFNDDFNDDFNNT